MILGFVILYLLLSVGIGLAAARRVHTTKDFVVAGRSLPLPIVIATVFATWFGAEAVLGISATFVKEGLRGVVADPFGSSLCLILVGLFFAPRFYRLNLLTVGDFYRMRYNRVVEVLCAVCIAASYLGWVAAQFKVRVALPSRRVGRLQRKRANRPGRVRRRLSAPRGLDGPRTAWAGPAGRR